MSVLHITGGRPLDGSIRVGGAKNSVLPVLSASILANGRTVIHNCPDLSDVDAAVRILRHLGCRVEVTGGSIAVDSSTMDRYDIPHSLMREMRSSIMFLGAILARTGKAVISAPGGCELGPRPINLDLNALRAMGVDITDEGGSLFCSVKKLTGCRINLSKPSVGATENIMLAATASSGETVITNAACEPEIWDLQNYLNAMGARVSGAGTATVTIEGGHELRSGAEHSVIPDRIVAATYLACTASAGGAVELTDVCPRHMTAVLDVLRRMGCVIDVKDNSISMTASGRINAVGPVITGPHPEFPTDAQPPIMAAVLRASGNSVFVENIFQNRFRHAEEMMRMGADIHIEGRVAVVTGVDTLHGAPVTATDLRGGASLIVAALAAEGVTAISEIGHIYRGYESIDTALRSLGADISLVD